MLPWTPLALAAIPPIVNWAKARRPLASRTWRMLAWAFLPLAFFTASIGKQPRYILPILPPLAVLLAATIMDRRARPQRPRCAAAGTGRHRRRAARRRWRSCSTGPNTSSSMVPTVFIFAAIIAIAVAAAVVLAAALAPRARARARRRGRRRRADAGGPAVRAVTRRPRPRAGHGHAGHCTPDAAGADRHVPSVRPEPGLLHRRQTDRPAQRSAGRSITCTRPSACCA